MKLIVLCLTAFMATVAYGQEIPHERCPQNATQEWIDVCVLKNYKIAQAVLDSVYQDALNRISDFTFEGKVDTFFAARKALIQSQRAWLKYRNACTNLIIGLYLSGSDAHAVAWTYKTKLTLDRIRELTFFAHSQALFSKPDWRWKPLQQ